MNSQEAAVSRAFWNEWNTAHRERPDIINHRSKRQAALILRWLESLGRRDLKILEVGCAGGWFAEQLAAYGHVTAQDLADELIGRAKVRAPHITWLAGDVMEMPFAPGSFDVIVHLEVLSHVADQPAFIRTLATWLRAGGHMMLATQNAFTLSRMSNIAPRKPGQLRQWVNATGLRRLAKPHFDVRALESILVEGDRGILRWINAPKLNRPFAFLLGSQERVDRLKERAGLGHTLMLWGERTG